MNPPPVRPPASAPSSSPPSSAPATAGAASPSPPSSAPPLPVPKELGRPLLPRTQLTRVRFSPDGQLLAAAAFDGTVKLWDLSGPEPVERSPVTGHHGWVCDLAFVGSTLLSVDSWGRLAATDVARTEPRPIWTVASAHDGWLRAVAVSRDGERLATCGRDGNLRLWNPRTGAKTGTFDLGTDLLSLCFSGDGRSLFVGDLFGTIHVVTLDGGRVARLTEAKEFHKADRIQDVGGVRGLLLAADAVTLFAFGAEPKGGGFVQAVPLLLVLDASNGRRIGRYRGADDNEGYVTDAAWHPDGFVAFTTSGQPGQGKFHLWKPDRPAPHFSGGKLPNCHSLAISPDGTRLAVSGTNANSSGNGRVRGMAGEYPVNYSPVQLWSLSRP